MIVLGCVWSKAGAGIQPPGEPAGGPHPCMCCYGDSSQPNEGGRPSNLILQIFLHRGSEKLVTVPQSHGLPGRVVVREEQSDSSG